MRSLQGLQLRSMLLPRYFGVLSDARRLVDPSLMNYDGALCPVSWMSAIDGAGRSRWPVGSLAGTDRHRRCRPCRRARRSASLLELVKGSGQSRPALPRQNGLSSIGRGWIAFTRTGAGSTLSVRTIPVTAVNGRQGCRAGGSVR